MKTHWPVVIFFVIALTYLLVPIFIGHIPSMPRKSGDGWTPVIDMRASPARFWRYEAVSGIVFLMLFCLYLLSRIEKGEDVRLLSILALFFGLFILAFCLS